MFFRIRVVVVYTQCNSITLFFMNKLIQYLKETKAELKEVVFPTTAQTVIFTVLVIVISVIVAVGLGGVDASLNSLLKQVVNR